MPRILLLAALAFALGACGDNNKAQKYDGGLGSDAGDSGVDAPVNPFAYCIDKPDNLVPAAPANGLPCDMFPPAALH
jgi:hypothetical protein